MRWKKLGLVYRPDGDLWWAKTHAMIPTPHKISDDVVRVYITCCDEKGIGRIGYVDISAHDPRRVLAISKDPLLDIGEPGTFDENGVLVTCMVDVPDGRRFMYYAGFELGKKIRYRLLTGLAIQQPGETVFRRIIKAPILERSDDELFFRCGPFVRAENGEFRMWYVAGSAWERIGNTTKPVYDIRYLESRDGVRWGEKGTPCIGITYKDEHGFGRPYVIHENGHYEMFYSIRRRSLLAYRIGYAESEDGIRWIRKDDEIGLDVSKEGWDAESVCYAAVIQTAGAVYMFYNGNNFGETGFGVAVLEQ